MNSLKDVHLIHYYQSIYVPMCCGQMSNLDLKVQFTQFTIHGSAKKIFINIGSLSFLMQSIQLD